MRKRIKFYNIFVSLKINIKPISAKLLIPFLNLIRTRHMQEYTFQVNSLADLPQVANEILKLADSRKKFVMRGQMGAGKTTLTNALCQALGCVDTVASPTYAIIHTYHTKERKPIHHVDLYRIDHIDDNVFSDLENIIYNDAYAFIEWADIISHYLDNSFCMIDISVLDENKREIRLKMQ